MPKPGDQGTRRRLSTVVEYRLNELARISGVSVRNIRAYRERGLLAPPRRQGRSAFYNDAHLAQLETVNQLLRRGFHTSHIAEFFASVRAGADLADVLGLPPAVTDADVRVSDGDPDVTVAAPANVADRLVAAGLAQHTDGGVVFLDPVIGRLVNGGVDSVLYLEAVLRIDAAARRDVDTVADAVVGAVRDGMDGRAVPDRDSAMEQPDRLRRMTRDYRRLARQLIAGRLDEALRSQMSSPCLPAI
ncbi:MerR family transcriptional regulator [Mycobacterium sp. PS03-16]|uniref:MerR family transcriptional regulator n=1 Tax=Mycobacterium sp. PS03-16 TaxID=2559611 RepID=UPI001073215A|nr:MerR family transcriptional regulator [Mycobacterium sp. PS03-16]